MTEVGPADRSVLLHTKQAELSSITRSRKRKLQELYSVATDRDAIPTDTRRDIDANPTTPAEQRWVTECYLLNGPIFQDHRVPKRNTEHAAAIQKFVKSKGGLGQQASKSPTKNGIKKSTSPRLASSVPGSGRKDSTKPLSQDRLASPAGQSTVLLSPLISSGPAKPTSIENSDARTRGDDGADSQQLPGRPSLPADTSDPRGVSKELPLNEPTQNGIGSTKAAPLPATRHDLPSETTDAASPAIAPQPGATAIDAGSGALGSKDTSHLSIQVPPTDAAKPHDTLSSPDSTVQTATTPAIHEASTDTSPDHEGAQYVDAEEGKVEAGQSNGQLSDGSQASRRPSGPAGATPRKSGAIVNGAEAQILGESAAATTAASETPGAHLEKNIRPATGDTSAPSLSKSPSKPRTMSTEIQDSQESSPVEAMDVDEPQDQQKVGLGESSEQPSVPGPSSRVEGLASLEQQETSRQPLSMVAPNALAGSSRPTTSGQQDSQQSRELSFAAKLKSSKRSGTPTVVFGKQQKRVKVDNSVAMPRSKSTNLISEDYFTPLFIQNFAQQSKRAKHLDHLVQSAQKTVSTSDLQTAMLENQACKILKRVYHLQQADKWSLRQPKRCPEPPRQPTHWDSLLQEMKWLRTDFREERKWKMTLAYNLALACAEWVSADPETRRALQVDAVIPTPMDGSDIRPDDGPEQASEEAQTVAPMDPTTAGDSPLDIDDIDAMPLTVAPSAIFAMRDNDVVFELSKTPASERLLEELPLYGAPLSIPQTGPDFDPDAHWKRPALPLSKYAEGQQVLVKAGHPRRKGRFQHDEEEDDEDQSPFDSLSNGQTRRERENADVALFDPEMAPIRELAQAGQKFRPPVEYNMPPQSFYENRLSSQWTMQEDDQLKGLVREYSYNWSLISSIIASKSMFSSSAERRTPWECFERWVCLEGIPEMGKTQYFRIFQARIDSSQKAIAEHNARTQQQQMGANGAVTPLAKKRPSTPVRVDRRKSQKHLAIFDGMRKLAKKRETIQQKQQAAAAASAARKPADAATPKTQLKTPRDYSIMRWERDQQLAEKMAQYAQRQQEANRRNQMIARGQGQQGGMGNPAQHPPQVAAQLAANPLASASRPNVPSQLAMPGQPRPRVPMPAPANGVPGMPANMRGGGLVAPVPMNGMTPAEMQARAAAQNMQMSNGQPDMRLVMQARLVQEQQRALAVLQQQQQGPQQPQQQAQQQQSQQGQQGQQGQQPSPGMPGGQGSPHAMRATMNGINQQNYLANAQAMMSPYAAANGAGMATPTPNGMGSPALPAGSPRALTTPQAQMVANQQHLAALASQMTPVQQQQIAELERSFRAKNPNLSAADARNLAISNLAIISRNQAMNAAAGGSPHHPLMNGITGTSPHQYAQLLRAQQQQQAQQQQGQVAGAPQPPQHQRQPSAGSASASK